MHSLLSTHLIRKNFASVAVIGLLAIFAGVFFVSIPVAHAATSCTSGVGVPLLVDVTQQISNDPDSGFFGDWAIDNFTRHIQIWEESGIYCAQADDVGTFTTFGGANGKSPQSGVALPEIVTGTMTGGTRGVLTGTLGDAGAWGTTGTAPAQDCNSISCSMTSLWVQNYFFGGSYDYSTAPQGDWSWTYDAGANGTWVNAASGSSPGDIVHVALSSVYVAPGGNDSNDGSVTHPFATIQAAVDAVTASGTITVAAGTYTLTSKIDITKTDITITGAGAGSTLIQGDVTVGENFFKILASGFTLQNVDLVKTDKTGLQNLLYIGASNTSIKNNSIHGQFVIGDGDVSRAMVFTGGLTGIQIDGNTIYALRQPGYLTGPTTGTISNNFVYGTKGWVLEGGDITMTGNTWGSSAQANVYDIAILPSVSAGSYTNILSMSAANNNAFIEDQRSSPAVLSTVYVDGNVSTTGDGTARSPKKTIAEGIARIVVGGTVNILPGDYNLIKDDATSVSGQTGWYLAITKNNIILQGLSASGQAITNAADTVANIYSTQETANGALATQNLITVFSDDVTIQGLGIMNKLSPNKGIEVLGNNFIARYNRFMPIPLSILPTAADYTDPDGSLHNDISKYGSGVYFNNNGATAARTATVTNNRFENSGITFDSFLNNWTVNIVDNVFDGNKRWDTSYYSAIGATTWAGQFDFTGSTLNMNNNAFVNMATDKIILKIRSDMTGSFDATSNYWGSVDGPTTDNLLGGVSFSPWWKDVAMTTLRYTTTASGGQASTTISATTVATTTTSVGTVNVNIPAGTVITGPDTWDGVLLAPTATSVYTITPDSGTSVSEVAIEIGAVNKALTFDKGVRLVFVGQAGKLAGWSRSGVFTKITTVCSADDQTVGDALVAGGDCKIDVGSDLVVWTKHFTAFITYTQTAISTSSGGGGGGGGGGGPSVALANNGGATPSTNTTGGTVGGTTGGQVLGAEAYNFTQNLTIGSKGDDVTELQKVLIAEGFLTINAPTGYFGSLTQSAVKKYQASHNITPQSGYVGSLTRMELSKGTTPGKVGASKQTLTDNQIQSIVTLLESFSVDVTTIANVSAILHGTAH